jgi:acetyl-CoA carboxylase biotin carboxyl carrier protein
MAEKTLITRVTQDGNDPDTLVLTSPVVGKVDGNLRKGTYLNPFDRLLTMIILNERYTLRLPRDVQGRITDTFVPNSVTPVAFDDPLVRIDPRAADGFAPEAGGGAAGVAGTDEASSSGAITISAPSEGIFYRRSSPDSDPYVEVGSKVATGTVLGLVEVMKCFNQITYGGAGLPEKGEVVRILVEDASEVQFGQALFWVKPTDPSPRS